LESLHPRQQGNAGGRWMRINGKVNFDAAYTSLTNRRKRQPAYVNEKTAKTGRAQPTGRPYVCLGLQLEWYVSSNDEHSIGIEKDS
jgi:hypothetical protein